MRLRFGQRLRQLKRVLGILLVASAITFAWFMIALDNPNGYHVLTSDTKNTVNNVAPFDTYDQTIDVYVEISLNPLAFPISHFLGNGVRSSHYTIYVPPSHLSRIRYFVDPNDIAILLVYDELPKNLPVFFFIGAFIGYFSNKLVKRLTHKRESQFSDSSLGAETI